MFFDPRNNDKGFCHANRVNPYQRLKKKRALRNLQAPPSRSSPNFNRDKPTRSPRCFPQRTTKSSSVAIKNAKGNPVGTIGKCNP